MRFTSVTFDLDGTLLDTAADLHAACNRMLAELGLPARSPEEIRRFVGSGAEKLVERCLSRDGDLPTPEATRQALERFRSRYREENGRTAVFYPHVVEALQAFQASGLPLAVVTNKPQEFAMTLLERKGLLSFFGAVVGGDATPYKKPHPEPILAACRALGVQAETNLHVGDSANDALSARAAGSQVWLVPYGYTEGQPISPGLCDRIIPDLLAGFRSAIG